jgi:hypothetical protein
VPSACDELVVCARHPDLERGVPARLERRRQPDSRARSVRMHFLWWLEEVDTVLGPQCRDGGLAAFGIGLVPERDVPVGKVIRIVHGSSAFPGQPRAGSSSSSGRGSKYE